MALLFLALGKFSFLSSDPWFSLPVAPLSKLSHSVVGTHFYGFQLFAGQLAVSEISYPLNELNNFQGRKLFSTQGASPDPVVFLTAMNRNKQRRALLTYAYSSVILYIHLCMCVCGVHSLSTILFTDPRHERKDAWRVSSIQRKAGSAQKNPLTESQLWQRLVHICRIF